jgi:predicted esterase
MIALAERIALPDIAWLALEAPGGSWYPGRFMEPIEANQPHLDRALDRIDHEVRALEARGVSRRRIALVGFSQGACVACEHLRRHPGRWGALIAFTGGLFGPPGSAWPDSLGADAGSGLDGTPVLLSNGDRDDWVPWCRVEDTAAVFRRMGAAVTLRLYPGREHVVSDDEIREARTILELNSQQQAM